MEKVASKEQDAPAVSTVPTWQSVGGSGAASSASSDEQTYRAQILYDRAGRGQWPTCGANL